jgi:hypothetical protein
MLQNHDAFVTQCDVDRKEDCVATIKEAFNIDIYINGKTLRIPIDMKIGKNWDEMTKIE